MEKSFCSKTPRFAIAIPMLCGASGVWADENVFDRIENWEQNFWITFCSLVNFPAYGGT